MRVVVLIISVLALMAGFQLVGAHARTADMILLALGAFGVGASFAGFVLRARGTGR
jgi:hypothetical protein